MPLRILYQDEHLVAVDKPAGFQVHPPEESKHSLSKSQNCLAILRDQLGRYVYPVHRLDRPTSGVLLFALTQEGAGALAEQFRERKVRKAYTCVVRGWVTEEQVIDRPLTNDTDPSKKVSAVTSIRPLAHLELPQAVGKYATARYTLIEAEPLTGRMHQIRRHLAGASHPILGDSLYGDGRHNRLFREELKIPALLLKAQLTEFSHPITGTPIQVQSRWTGKWHRVFDLFGVCPWSRTEISQHANESDRKAHPPTQSVNSSKG